MEKKKKAGRPPIPIDKRMFEKLCGIQCKKEEIASVLECSEDTIDRWCKRNYADENGKPMCFSQVQAKYQSHGYIALRRYQLDLAKKSATMAIWLGKQWLGQRDIQAIQLTGNNAGPVKVETQNGIDLSSLSAAEIMELVRTVFNNGQGNSTGAIEGSISP